MTVVLTLSRDWDLALQAPNGDERMGHFVGRRRELDLLANEIVRSTQRSIFVGGYRGVGKTSLVYAALQQAKNTASGKEFLFVLLNAAQLEAESPIPGEELDPRQILLNLIRRLYTASWDHSLSESIRAEISRLYQKAAATEFSEQIRLDTSSIARQVEEKAAEISLSTRETAAIWTGSLALAALVAALPWSFGFVDEALPLLLAVPVPLGLQAAFQRKRLSSVSTQSEDAASTLYSYDNSLGNLEFDLEAIQSSLAVDDRTVVYVIDELDKVSPERVVEVLRFFKSLFTLSAAVFIFIGSEELAARFRYALGTGVESYRAMEYTYFTSQYFLARPEVGDLMRYMDEVTASVEATNEESTEAVLADFKALLVFDSRGDFFDYKQILRDRITRFDEHASPVIQIEPLSAAEEHRMKLGRVVDGVFEAKYRAHNPSRWRENDLIVRGLYEVAHAIADGYTGLELSDEQDATIYSAAKRDLRAQLGRLGVLDASESEPTDIEGAAIEINTYRYTGIFPSDLGAEFGFLSELERRFVGGMDLFHQRVWLLNNVEWILKNETPWRLDDTQSNLEPYLDDIAGWGLDIREAAERASEVYEGLKDSLPKFFSRETIEQQTQEVASLNEALRTNGPLIAANVFAQCIENVTATSLPAAPDVFVDLGEDLREVVAALPHAVVIREDLLKQIVFVASADKALIEHYRSALNRLQGRHRLVLLWERSEELPRLPKIVRTVSAEPDDLEATVDTVKKLGAWIV